VEGFHLSTIPAKTSEGKGEISSPFAKNKREKKQTNLLFSINYRGKREKREGILRWSREGAGG